ncbi:MAG: hypothetical protein IKC09_05850 [Oscillospiraceae bacterium]|nr:hypothetical protein [Oscillospiraceae bacterium]
MAKYSSGLQPIIDDLSAKCTSWMNNGGKDTGANGKSKMEVSDYSVKIQSESYPFTERTFWTGAGVYPFEEEELAAFCQRNNFTYYLSYRGTKDFYVVIYCNGRAILLESELLDQWRAQKQADRDAVLRLTRLIPLAEKFYHTEVFQEMAAVLGNVSDYYSLHRELNFTYEGFHYKGSRNRWKYGGSLIHFSRAGYRDLANDDELIAFVFACTAKYYGKTPKTLDPAIVEPIKIEMWNGKRTIRFLPKLLQAMPDIKPNPIPKKDFF